MKKTAHRKNNICLRNGIRYATAFALAAIAFNTGEAVLYAQKDAPMVCRFDVTNNARDFDGKHSKLKVDCSQWLSKNPAQPKTPKVRILQNGNYNKVEVYFEEGLIGFGPKESTPSSTLDSIQTSCLFSAEDHEPKTGECTLESMQLGTAAMSVHVRLRKISGCVITARNNEHVPVKVDGIEFADEKGMWIPLGTRNQESRQSIALADVDLGRVETMERYRLYVDHRTRYTGSGSFRRRGKQYYIVKSEEVDVLLEQCEATGRYDIEVPLNGIKIQVHGGGNHRKAFYVALDGYIHNVPFSRKGRTLVKEFHGLAHVLDVPSLDVEVRQGRLVGRDTIEKSELLKGDGVVNIDLTTNDLSPTMSASIPLRKCDNYKKYREYLENSWEDVTWRAGSLAAKRTIDGYGQSFRLSAKRNPGSPFLSECKIVPVSRRGRRGGDEEMRDDAVVYTLYFFVKQDGDAQKRILTVNPASIEFLDPKEQVTPRGPDQYQWKTRYRFRDGTENDLFRFTSRFFELVECTLEPENSLRIGCECRLRDEWHEGLVFQLWNNLVGAPLIGTLALLHAAPDLVIRFNESGEHFAMPDLAYELEWRLADSLGWHIFAPGYVVRANGGTARTDISGSPVRISISAVRDSLYWSLRLYSSEDEFKKCEQALPKGVAEAISELKEMYLSPEFMFADAVGEPFGQRVRLLHALERIPNYKQKLAGNCWGAMYHLAGTAHLTMAQVTSPRNPKRDEYLRHARDYLEQAYLARVARNASRFSPSDAPFVPSGIDIELGIGLMYARYCMLAQQRRAGNGGASAIVMQGRALLAAILKFGAVESGIHGATMHKWLLGMRRWQLDVEIVMNALLQHYEVSARSERARSELTKLNEVICGG